MGKGAPSETWKEMARLEAPTGHSLRSLSVKEYKFGHSGSAVSFFVVVVLALLTRAFSKLKRFWFAVWKT